MLSSPTSSTGRGLTPPGDYGNVVQFKEPVSTAELRRLIDSARGDALAKKIPGYNDPDAPERLLTWEGESLPVSALAATLVSVARRLRGKTGPVVTQSRRLPDSIDGSEIVLGTPAGQVSGKLEAGDGQVWVLTEPMPGMVMGQEMVIRPGSFTRDDSEWGIACLGPGFYCLVKRVSVTDAVTFRERRLDIFKQESVPGAGAGPIEDLRTRLGVPGVGAPAVPPVGQGGTATPPASDGAAAGGDARTMWVDYDAQGERFKNWRSVVRESQSLQYSGYPLDGPASVMGFAKHTDRHGGDPRLWLAIWAREKNIDAHDRVFHEMTTLTEALYHAGTYDQLNIGGLVCLEVLARRAQSIIDAYSVNPTKPNWSGARFFTGSSSAVDAVDRGLLTYANRQRKEEHELSTGGRGAPGGGKGDGAGADSAATQPDGPAGDGGKGGKKGGRRLPQPAAQ